MAQFFIHRPVFAWVLAIVTMLAGGFSILTLPVSQYPDIAPTTIRISANYSGATAQAVQNSVTKPIEDSLTGLDGLLYTVSSSATGRSTLTLTFDDSVTPVDALNEVQSKVRSVEGRLPSPVQTDGVRISRSSTSILMVAALVSTENRHSRIELGNLIEEVIEGPVKRVEGVGEVNVFGSGYAMRIWLDPLRLAQFQLTPSDITSAVAAQNTTVSVGSLGSQPVTEGQQFTATITAQSQLTSVDDFRNILLKTGTDGATVRLGDVAEVEIGQESYGADSRFNGNSASGFRVSLANGANAVDTAAGVRAVLENLKSSLPDGLEVQIAYDTAPFVELSIEKVYHTLIEAIVLVFLVILIFLQNWRATLIPIIAVPVVLLGTFGMLAALGYSINTLTMFAMVLAIGLLVDDAIVVVENVERVMTEEGLGPVEATEKSMKQISGALIGIALVLSAVFVPMAFMPGSTGVVYRQFSVTIITAMVLSLFVALILTPAMCASMLRQSHGPARFAPARWFNAAFERATNGYGATVARTLRRPFVVMVALAIISFGVYDLFARMTSSFLPAEDQGVLQVQINLSEGTTSQQTAAVAAEIEDYLLNDESDTVEGVLATLGWNFAGSSQARGLMFVKLRDFAERKGADQSARALAARANAKFGSHRAGRIMFLQPPAIPGLGNSSGFSMYLLDQAGNGREALTQASEQLEQIATSDARLQNVEARGTDDDAALKIDIDQQKAESFGVRVAEVNAMLSTIFAGTEVNDFALGAQLRPVIVQSGAENRMQPEDVEKWYARNSGGEMVPFSAFMATRWEPVDPRLQRIDAIDAIEFSGQPSESASSGTAMAAMEELVSDMPGYGIAWTELSYQERQSGNQAPFLYALSVLVVFLCLAALYESWSIPFSVMLAVPVGVLGAVIAALTFGQANDVYFKVGILTTIGLAAKNAILIVEFARDLEDRGRETIAAAIEAARLRLRPILMTSLAFILGVTPLAIATGAGAAAQNAIGIGVMGGMIAATFLGIFLVPGFYVVIRRLTTRRGGKGRSKDSGMSPTGPQV